MSDETGIKWLKDFHEAMRQAQSIQRGLAGLQSDLEYVKGETPLVLEFDHLCLELGKQLQQMKTAVHSMIHDEYTRGQAELGKTLTSLLKAATSEGEKSDES